MTSVQQKNPLLLDVRDLCLSFREQEHLAVDQVSFKVRRGSTLGLVGASGAGKSSIARAIMRLLEPDSGEILFNGEDICKMDSKKLLATRQRIQLVFQNPFASLSPRRRIEQILLEPMKHFAIGDSQSRHARIRQTLGTVGLDADVLQRFPHQFSGGQQQRIAIARALVTKPDLLIADEAVSSLDVSIQAQILQLIQTLQKEHGIAFLFISHDLAVIRQIADEVAVMFKGQMLERSPADVFFSSPAHPYSKTLLSFATGDPKLQPTGHKLQIGHGSALAINKSQCIFAMNCPEKMPLCERHKPACHDIPDTNQHALGSYCVKCHLYNTEDSDDN
jgi:peptide/nickel transport system ATP-binding protein/oligopeptide transport system ATP-binding protein